MSWNDALSPDTLRTPGGFEAAGAWRAAVGFERRRVPLAAGFVSYDVGGEGPPVVLVHGLSGSSRWWARNARALAREFRVYVIDLFGFGGSRDGQPFVLAEAADCLECWMGLVGLERASIVGHSMGGLIAANLAADFPARVDRLVLVDATVIPLERGKRQKARNLVGAVRRMPLNFLPILAMDALRAGPITIAKAAREILIADIRPKLARILAPTLVVWGEHDALISVELGRQLCGLLPDSRFVVVEQAGHNPMWERPAAFNRLVAEFLAGDEPTGALATSAGPRAAPATLQRPE